MKNYFVILIAGGSCSGKTEFAKWFKNSLLVDLDRFYLPFAKIPRDGNGIPNFDTPEGVAIDECAKMVERLAHGEKVQVPTYSFIKNDRTGTEAMQATKTTKFIVVEGMYALFSPLKELGDLNIFLDTPAEIRVARRMIRDVERKNRTKSEILSNFVTAEEGYQKYVERTKKFADLIIPFSSNPVKF